MKYIRIIIEGERRRYARLRRKQDGEHIEVELITPTLRRTHHVRADDREDQWSIAECLQETLDGYRGTDGDVRQYFSALEHLAD
ncbi:MAG: hypothetical protein ACF8NJ_05915 [Phycisphaerales bacterium JB038]